MGKKKILVVDDELYIRDLVTNALEEDYIVLEASDGEQAIGIVSKQKPDLILMDVLLPKLDGVSACCVIKSGTNTKTIPIIMMSGRTDKIDQDYSKEIGADDYLTKPFDIEELLDKVDQYFDQSRNQPLTRHPEQQLPQKGKPDE